MAQIFTLEMLPAREGDCLWITYGDEGRPRHILVDAGRKATGKLLKERLKALPPGEKRLELVVVTHIDRDHIEGMLDLAEARFEGVEVGDIWFNGRIHLQNGFVAQGARQGERLGDAISTQGFPWNAAFEGARVAIEPGAPVRLPARDGGLEITLLSPTPAKLSALLPVWDREIARAGLEEGRRGTHDGPAGFERLGGLDVETLAAAGFTADRTEPNGTSIALLLEFSGKRVLLAADAHSDVLSQSLRALGGGERVRLDAFKLPHHASARNLSRDVLDLVDCRRFLVSTNGSYFNHPDQEAIARVIRHGGERPEIVFNYRTDETSVWDDNGLKTRFGYSTAYPPGRAGHQIVDLMDD